jgi:hypothetical protein
MNYLDYEVTEIPDSVENLFCKPLDQNGEIQKASEMQMSLIFFSVTSNKEEVDEMYESVKKEHMLLLILEDRLKKIGCSLDKASRLLVSTACKSPGEVVMYSSYIRYKMKELEIDFLDIEKLCSEIFPDGFFTEKTLREHWDIQKVNTGGNSGSDNLLDYLKAYESMMK